MQMPTPVRAPAFLSRRRLLERKLAVLHNCTDLNELKQLHALTYKFNLHGDPFVASKLISGLSMCGQMALAIIVFDKIRSPNAHVCNALIRAYVRNSHPEKAFEVFGDMQRSGILPDNYTYFVLLKACSTLGFVKIVHAYVEKLNLYSDLFVLNSLIDAYSRCGLIGVRAARKVFDLMEDRDVVSYNSMISGLVKSGELKEAKKLFDEMPQRDRISWNAILNGYVKAGKMIEAFEIFQEMPSRDVISWSTLISGFAKAGDIEMAKVLFDKMPVKNLVTWTMMISGYAEMGLTKEANGLYDQMEAKGLELDDGALVSILSASAESGLLDLGKKVHRSIVENQYHCGTLVNNALIDMYRKCGSMSSAWRIFNAMGRKDLVSWNVMINGLAMHGHGQKALQLFNQMQEGGFAPDKVTFVGVLSACSHSGMVKDGIHYFYTMESDYCITPEIEHYGCLIDLLGRTGHLSEALTLLYGMPFKPNVVIWSSILASCRMHNAVELVEIVLDQLMKLEPADAGSFSMLSNMHALTGDWGSVTNARMEMKIFAKKGSPEVSLIQLDNKFNEFTVLNSTHPTPAMIYQTIHRLNQRLPKLSHTSNVVI